VKEHEVGTTINGAQKFMSMYLLRTGNDTVPSSAWRGGGVRCTECRLLLQPCYYATTSAVSRVTDCAVDCLSVPSCR